MGLKQTGTVGPTIHGDGQDAYFRTGRTGESIVQQLHGRYFESAFRGNIFSGCNPVAGVDHGSTIGTTPPLALYNPAGSPVNLVILSASIAYVSGTLGAGFVVYGANNNPAAAKTTGTAVVPVGGNILVPAGYGQLFSAATVPVNPTTIRPFCSLLPMLATTPGAPFIPTDNVDGAIVVPPGCTVSLQGICGAAGTTPRVVFGLTWEEVPI